MAWETLRTIVEELDVSEQVDLYTEKYPRFDEAWEGLKWLLARTPDLKGAAVWAGDWVGEGSFRAYAAAGNPLATRPISGLSIPIPTLRSSLWGCKPLTDPLTTKDKPALTFEELARELECDDDEAAFDERLRRLAKAATKPKPSLEKPK